MDNNMKRLLVLTLTGDCIEILLNDASTNSTVKAERINSVVRLRCRNNKALTILTQSE